MNCKHASVEANIGCIPEKVPAIFSGGSYYAESKEQ